MTLSPLQKHTLNLRKGDVDYLSEVYVHKGVPISQVIRLLVSNHVDKLRRAEGPALTLDIGEI